MTDEELLQEIEAQRALMIAVATGGPRIESVNHDYTERRVRIATEFARRGLNDPNPHGDLWQWYGKWSGGDLPTYQSRRKHVSELYQPLIDRIIAEPSFERPRVPGKPTTPAAVPRNVSAAPRRPEEIRPEWDVFICHASEDKEDFVRPLAEALQNTGLRVWYDQFTLRLGDSLRRSIDQGLARSKYGVVVLSPHFFAKEWPQRELDGLVGREVEGRKVILPVWHNIDGEKIRKFSPPLADRVAVKSSEGLERVVKELLRAITE